MLHKGKYVRLSWPLWLVLVKSKYNNYDLRMTQKQEARDEGLGQTTRQSADRRGGESKASEKRGEGEYQLLLQS